MSTIAASTLEQAAAQLAAIIGQENTQFSGTTIVVAPTDSRQIADVLRLAGTKGFPVTPTGNGTKLAWGNPVAPVVFLSLRRMNALREYAWQDMTCTVEAGCTWADMQAELARHGQMVALDPLWPERSTVGGIVAVNDSGALRFRYGPLRDLIIGMTVVLADGTIARTGGKVVKNVAGYDLHKLLTGSYGTLGVIAEVNFRLHPVEHHVRIWTAVAPDASHFDEALRALMEAQMSLSCVQLRVRRQECALDVRMAAVAECLEEHAVRLRNIFSQTALRESGEAVWRARQEFFETGDAVVLKASLLPSEIGAVTVELQHWANAEGLEIAAVAQAYGQMTVAIRSAPDAAIAVIERLRARLRDSGGTVVAMQVPEGIRRRFDVWGCDSNALPLMREIKRRFDPGCILNPGRFVGGI